MWNPKNNLQEFVQNIGYLADCITYELLEKKVIKQERYELGEKKKGIEVLVGEILVLGRWGSID